MSRMSSNPSIEFVKLICRLYDDVYDDREEDSRPQGTDWKPGIPALHKSLGSFQKDLEDIGYKMSRTKLQKILITGGCWTTERSREIQELYDKYKKSMPSKKAMEKIATELEISIVSVNINLPYEKVVYDLEEKSKNAKRIERHRSKK